MKNKRITFINCGIIGLVLFGILLYARFQNEFAYKKAVKGYENSALSISSVIACHMQNEQDTVNNWKNSIDGMGFSQEEAIYYVKKFLKNTKASVHMIWEDSLEGLSSDSEIIPVNYNDVENSPDREASIYDFSPKKAIESLNFEKNGIHLTASYKNPINGEKVVAFAQKVEFLDNQERRNAILLYVFPVSYLAEKWIYSSNYINLVLSLIEKNGNFVIRPFNSEDSNFYNLIYSSNSNLTQDLTEEKIFGEKNSSFVAYDFDGNKNRYAYVVISETENHAIILEIPDSALAEKRVDWFVVIVMILALIATLCANLVYIKTSSETTEKYIETINKQNEQLKKEWQRAEKASNSKTVFLNNVSHDIRTPMNAIIGFTNLAFTSIDNHDRIFDYLTKISTASTHLLELINDVLDMGQIESGKLELTEKETNLKTIINEIKTVFDEEANAKKINFSIDTQITNYNVICDKLRVQKVLHNLISNSIKYTSEKGIVYVKITEIPEADEEYSVYECLVKDNGIGMSQEFVEKVFEPFERERTSTISGIQGTGLGMAIAKNIVDLMKGDIQVHSVQNAGTEFTVKLKFKICKNAVEDSEEIPINTVKDVKFDGRRILLVEDNVLNQEIAMTILEQFGLSVDLAGDGTTAVEMMRKASSKYYDIVLMDIQMPIMNGYDATKAIRKFDDAEKATVPIIAMTANAFEEDKNKAKAAGMNGYIAKPIDLKELVKVLQNFLNPIEELEESSGL